MAMPELGMEGSERAQDLRVVSEGYAIRLYPIDEAEEIRLLDLWRVLWNRRLTIMLFAAAGAVTATIAAFLITPMYRAEVLMAPVGNERGGALASLAGELGGIAALAGISLGTDSSSAEALATLRSRAFTEHFIEKNNLMPVLFADVWDPAKGAWDVDDPADVPTLWRASERFDNSIRSVTQDAETGLVTLTVDWKDPELARAWANGLVQEVNAALRGRAIQQSRKSIEYLRKELQGISEVELRAAVFDLMEAEMKNAMVSTVRTEFAFEVIDPAVVPEKRYWPNRWLLAVLGLAAGLLLGVLAVALRQSYRR
jgi:uncharacterized protein involved in exopolysaccharide biosynthesis